MDLKSAQHLALYLSTATDGEAKSFIVHTKINPTMEEDKMKRSWLHTLLSIKSLSSRRDSAYLLTELIPRRCLPAPRSCCTWSDAKIFRPRSSDSQSTLPPLIH